LFSFLSFFFLCICACMHEGIHLYPTVILKSETHNLRWLLMNIHHYTLRFIFVVTCMVINSSRIHSL
jgi:hypothetical protein